jgi:hypothetical protein
MLALLLASVLAALAVSRHRGAPVRCGGLILQQLAARGLSEAFTEPAHAWFLAENPQGRPVACLASVAGSSQKTCGGLDLELQLTPDGGGLFRMQRWSTNDDLSALACQIRIESGSGLVLQEVDATATTSVLRLQLRQLNRRNQAQAPRPDNLVPAGAMPSGAGWLPLLARQVMDQRQSATFVALPGAQPLQRGELGLEWLQIEPAGPSEATASWGGQDRQAYSFDQDGVYQITIGDRVYRRVSMAVALRRLPQARALASEVRRFEQQLGPAPDSQDQPRIHPDQQAPSETDPGQIDSPGPPHKDDPTLT